VQYNCTCVKALKNEELKMKNEEFAHHID